MSDLKLLVHTCCAPCFIAPYQQLMDEGIKVSAFWFNPNIHPLLEYQKRRDALRKFVASEGLKLIEHNEYGLREFLADTLNNTENRCEYCYRVRLEAVAKTAKNEGYNAFSTTLLYSRYQKHELIKSIADEMSRLHGVDFYYQDWRSLWQKGIQLSKAEGMYRQQYCGCIFSEEDRYHE